jgi:hypothetical protein
MPNPAKIRPYCANGCARRIKPQRVAYCSQRCQFDHYRQRVISLWQSGALPPRLYFNRTVRRHIIESVGERCQRCSWGERNPFTGQIPLEIEHVDGDWKNNAPANIRVLCPNCHALTATFRGANRGRGRPGRPRYQMAHPAPIRPFSWTGRTSEGPLFSPLPANPWDVEPSTFRRYHGLT